MDINSDTLVKLVEVGYCVGRLDEREDRERSKIEALRMYACLVDLVLTEFEKKLKRA